MYALSTAPTLKAVVCRKLPDGRTQFQLQDWESLGYNAITARILARLSVPKVYSEPYLKKPICLSICLSVVSVCLSVSVCLCLSLSLSPFL